MPEEGVENGDAGWREPVPLLRESRYSQSLERGLAILECFTPERPVWGIADLAQELGMSRSTTHRYVLTLTALGHLVQDARRKYQMGLAVTELGMSALGSTALRDHARAPLRELSRRAPYTLVLAMLDGPELVYVEHMRTKLRSQRLLDLDLEVGSRLPPHSCAMGKLLIARLPTAERRHLLAGLTLTRRGPNTIVGGGALREELERIAGEPLVGSDQELAAGHCEIAAPVRRETDEVAAALAMQAHSSLISLEQLRARLGPHLIASADRISARLGYRREDERARG
jgi:IclR family transcriptional regulator, pca regulon regulatory protein